MDSDLEKQFFNTFGIEPMPYCCYHDCNCPINDVGKFNSKCPKQAVTKECDARIIQKPQITDRILLELICIHNNYLRTHLYSVDYESLVKEVLKDLINEQEKKEFKTYHVVDDMKREVQALFEKG